MDAGGDEAGAADACCDEEAGDFCEDVDFSEVLAIDAYEDAVSNGEELLLTDDAFLALDGSALLIDTKGLIGLTG